MSEQEQLELLRSVLACAYERPQPLPLRLMNTIKKHIGSRTPRKPIIESLNIIDGEASGSSPVSGGEYPLGTKWTS
jgi:hypothetical protein